MRCARQRIRVSSWKEDPLANVSSKPSSPPPPEGLLWGEGESSAGRKPPERSPELKGVFGAGASVVSGPEIAKASAARSGEHEGDPSTSGEHLAATSRRRNEPPTNPALRAQGLWTNAAREGAEPSSPPKVVNLPRAVLGEGPPSVPLSPPVEPGLPAAPVANENAQPLPPPVAAAAAFDEPVISEPAPTTAPPVVPAGVLPSGREWQSGPPSELERETAADRTVTLPPLLGGRVQPAAAEPVQPKAAEPVAPEPIAAEPAPAPTKPAKKPVAAPTPQPKAAEPAPAAAVATDNGPSVGVRLGLVFAFAVLLLLVLLGGGMLGFWRLPWSAPKAPAPEAVPATSARTPTPQEAVEARIAASRAELAQKQPAEPAAAQPTAAANEAPAAPQPSAAVTTNTATTNTATAAPAQPAAPTPPPAAAAAPAEPQAEPNEPAAASTSEDFLLELRKARDLLKGKNPAAAEALMLTWVDRAPTDPRVGELLTQAYLDQKQGDKALATAQQVVRKRPKRALSRVLLGDALEATGDRNGAQAAWREALELDPENKPAKRRLKE